jgi:hypothetical protein
MHEDTVELHLSRLIGMVSHLDMQIIGFFFENRPYWQFEVSTVTVYSTCI